jgi:coenzyme F420-0:L-glutamate ligase/coenzyme F420-1:gamma-L-glutamate ligase
MRVDGWARKFLIESRLGHMATSTKRGKPHVVPICYVLDGASLYTPIDEKPKRRKPTQLRRALNITENPNVCMVVDHYEEDWSKLKYVIVRGSAEIVHEGEAHERAVMLLREKYKRYRQMKLEHRPLIKINPISVVAWNARGV